MPSVSTPGLSASRRRNADRARQKFLRYFRRGFHDPTYREWERDYKRQAHEAFGKMLSRSEMDHLIAAGEFLELSGRAIRIESRTNLLFSFEKMALRDAVRTLDGARSFALGLRDLAYGGGSDRGRFERFGAVLSSLPRRQTRVHTWPLQTVFSFIARPDRDIFLKPTVTRRAAASYGFDLHYTPAVTWPTYLSLRQFAAVLWNDLEDLEPRDLIDIQSFIWVLGSDEYPD